MALNLEICQKENGFGTYLLKYILQNNPENKKYF